jgi:ribose-phosphate pyrophosphokinase
MIDTAGTITQAVQALKAHGAKRVMAACSHAVLSGPAIKRINESELDEVVVTNTIAMDNKQKECPKLVVLTVAPLLGEAIRRIHEEASVSSLFM